MKSIIYNTLKESNRVPLFVLGLNGLSFDGVLDQVCRMIPGLVAYWNFDNQRSQTVYDYSSNASNGYLGTSTSTQSNDPLVAKFANKKHWTKPLDKAAMDAERSKALLAAKESKAAQRGASAASNASTIVGHVKKKLSE